MHQDNGPKKSIEEEDGDDYVAWGDAFSQDDAKNDGDNALSPPKGLSKWLSWTQAFVQLSFMFSIPKCTPVEKTSSSHYCGIEHLHVLGSKMDCKRGLQFARATIQATVTCPTTGAQVVGHKLDPRLQSSLAIGQMDNPNGCLPY